MRHARARLRRQGRGFTAVELVSVLAMSALILGSLIVGYGTIVRTRPGVSSLVTVPLGATRAAAFAYPDQDGTTRNVVTAPHFGMVAQAEELREQFNADVISATAVFCLPRDGVSTYKPSSIPYDPLLHGELDTPQKFRAHLVAIGVIPMPFRDYRNPLNSNATTPSENVSIFILGYSKVELRLKVLALYEIDVVRFTGTTDPLGFYASVKRYSDDSRDGTYPLAFSGGYEVFYPPSIPAPVAARPQDWGSDGFTPLFITFERSTRLAIAEGTTTDRFKVAAERPFYFIWWPDPAARHLGPVTNTLNPADPRQAYNQMGGRTSFMFTVPMFPAL
ncbi:hypothetical protein [Brevifollis gellanilyticus]|uniref:Uncharacterized protein n=1 Tax=Brevifollis gellanilyticus TaxID=748831 RepID=A0A512M3C8_9BACT|nr:hypothetical protein [Brevifollis gellanilyticus]GEP41246.1 hypothetical protein BGE01nite_05370 [Brevifollis gellanilyticus]